VQTGTMKGAVTVDGHEVAFGVLPTRSHTASACFRKIASAGAGRGPDRGAKHRAATRTPALAFGVLPEPMRRGDGEADRRRAAREGDTDAGSAAAERRKPAEGRARKCSPADVRIFIFDEATRGVDVGSEGGDLQPDDRLTARGAGIIMISSERRSCSA